LARIERHLSITSVDVEEFPPEEKVGILIIASAYFTYLEKVLRGSR
jgi:hypothetical protein